MFLSCYSSCSRPVMPCSQKLGPLTKYERIVQQLNTAFFTMHMLKCSGFRNFTNWISQDPILSQFKNLQKNEQGGTFPSTFVTRERFYDNNFYLEYTLRYQNNIALATFRCVGLFLRMNSQIMTNHSPIFHERYTQLYSATNFQIARCAIFYKHLNRSRESFIAINRRTQVITSLSINIWEGFNSSTTSSLGLILKSVSITSKQASKQISKIPNTPTQTANDFKNCKSLCTQFLSIIQEIENDAYICRIALNETSIPSALQKLIFNYIYQDDADATLLFCA